MAKILDSTLREGEQTPGVYFPKHIKLEIANQLDRLNVDFIEAGHPLVSENIKKAVKLISGAGLNSVICAHSRSLRQDIDMAIECGVGFLGIFYCVSNGRLKNVFNISYSKAVDHITQSISYAKSVNPDLIIRYTPEDTVRSDFDNTVNASAAAVDAGADIISIADTTGFMIPNSDRSMFDYILRFKEALDRKGASPMIAVHCHNDLGLAVVNALDAFKAGVDIIDVSVLGLGERTGIADLASLLAVLSQFDGYIENINLFHLMPLYQLVSKYSGVPIPVNSPVTGNNAFKHCAGVHTHAAKVNPLHYQSLEPEIFGRKMEISLDHMSGISSVKHAVENLFDYELDNEIIKEALKEVKQIGETGRTVEQDELKMIINWIQNLDKEISNVI